MKLFIRHATADAELATKFVDMLQLGVGALHQDVFFSSAKGAIRNGDFFVQHILKERRSHPCPSDCGLAQAPAETPANFSRAGPRGLPH